jgi:2,4-dienoyl-CoA reductase-like NADH-dependent reductase (Old Yellow Enzyme family)
MSLFEPLTLPNGRVIANRIAKAAMEENMADPNNAPSDALFNLYKAWGQGGSGLIITGNVMIDYRGMTSPGGVVLEDDSELDKFKHWAKTAKAAGSTMWMQINHPGRQMPANLGQTAIAPSALPLDLGKLTKNFAPIREMAESDIQDIIQRFARTASLAEQSGFDGVQIHAAHGYLISQFLSPLSNQRHDQWGGSLENRARLLIEVIRAVNAVVSPTFAISVKLNSADFQRGGFSPEEAAAVITMLNSERVDLVELSGGSYEAPAMQGDARDGRTLEREAFFLTFAKDIARHATMPIMVTGGIRRLGVANKVLDSGIDMVGIASALAITTDLPNRWKKGEKISPSFPAFHWRQKTLAALAHMAIVKYQLRRIANGKTSQPNVAPWWAFLVQQVILLRRAKRYQVWAQQRLTG